MTHSSHECCANLLSVQSAAFTTTSEHRSQVIVIIRIRVHRNLWPQTHPPADMLAGCPERWWAEEATVANVSGSGVITLFP